MMVKLVWVIIGLNILLILYFLLGLGNGQQDAAGKSMASGFIALMVVGAIISVLLVRFSQHPLVLLLATLLSSAPIFLSIYLVVNLIKQSNPTPHPMQQAIKANFSSPLQIALAQAILDGDVLAIDGLIAQGAKIDTAEQGGKTPMEFAFEIWTDYEQSKVNMSIYKLIQKGVPADKYFMQAVEGTSEETLRIFLNAGVDPNMTDQNGEAAIVRAIKSKKLPSMHMLVEKGANMDVSDQDGYTPLMLVALQENWYEVLWLLEKGADYTYINENGISVVSLLRKRYHKDPDQNDLLPDFFVRIMNWLKIKGIDISRQESPAS